MPLLETLTPRSRMGYSASTSQSTLPLCAWVVLVRPPRSTMRLGVDPPSILGEAMIPQPACYPVERAISHRSHSAKPPVWLLSRLMIFVFNHVGNLAGIMLHEDRSS